MIKVFNYLSLWPPPADMSASFRLRLKSAILLVIPPACRGRCWEYFDRQRVGIASSEATAYASEGGRGIIKNHSRRNLLVNHQVQRTWQKKKFSAGRSQHSDQRRPQRKRAKAPARTCPSAGASRPPPEDIFVSVSREDTVLTELPPLIGLVVNLKLFILSLISLIKDIPSGNV